MEENKMTPQERYHKKVGWKAKSYMLKEEVTTKFAEACKKAGVSQAGQITLMMEQFIKEHEQ